MNIFLSLIVFSFFFLLHVQKRRISGRLFKFSEKIVKIDGKFASFIPSNSFEVLKNINSDDCDSWKLNIKFSDLFDKSYKKLLNSMFEDITFTDNVLSSDVLEANNFISFIHLKNPKLKLILKLKEILEN